MIIEALDFLNEKIHVGDFIAYPTGGTSARLVLAYVSEIVYLDRLPPDRFGNFPSPVIDGSRGPSHIKLKVRRLQEGNKRAELNHGPHKYFYGPKPEKTITIDQLHRVVKVTKPDWVDEILTSYGI